MLSGGRLSTGQTATGLARAADLHAQHAEEPLGVVAGRRRLDDRRRAVLRQEAGEQDAGLDLRARGRQLVADPVELRASHDDGRPALVRLDFGAHQTERLLHAHGPGGERLVADQLEPTVLTGQHPGCQTEDGAGVAAVERAVGLREAAQAAAGDPDDLVHDRYLHAERAHDLDRRVRVGGVTEAAQLALPVGDRAEEDAALADPLHGRDADRADHRRRGLDLHCSSRTDEITTL